MLAKHATVKKARRTVLGFKPAILNSHVIGIRSMFVLLKVAEIVKPPMRSIIVGENTTEKMCLGMLA